MLASVNVCVLPLIYSDWECDLGSLIINTKRTNKNNAAHVLSEEQSLTLFMQACSGQGNFWEPDVSFASLEISWGVSGHPENNVGLYSPHGWDLCKVQLKPQSKDMATLGGHHWI